MTRRGRLNYTIVESEKTTKIALAVEKSRQKRLRREKWALEIARSRGVLTPLVLDYRYGVDENQEKEILVLETIRGKELSFDEDDINIQAMYLVGYQLSLLGMVSNSGFGWPHPETLQGEFKTWKSFLYFFVEKYGKRLSEKKVISVKMLEDLLEIIRMARYNVMIPSLIHRDIKPANVLWTLKGPYIIDWENALLGDSLFDLAQYDANYGRDSLWQAFADGLNQDIGVHYRTYEAVALLGVIDFYCKQGLNYSRKKQQLCGLFQEMDII